MEYRHIKSKRVYNVVHDKVINATNKDDGTIMVLYQGEKKDGSGEGIFVRINLLMNQ